MRIIAGEFRGRKLLGPVGQVTRPITDRVKQSLFDIITPQIPGATVCDLFCGTGSMGLECISRGADHVSFFDADRSAIEGLKKNIATLGVNERCTVVAGDVFKSSSSRRARDAKIALVFLDPPYRLVRERSQEIQQLAARLSAELSPEGLLIFRHDSADELLLPPLRLVDQRDYGGMRIDFLVRASVCSGI